MAAKTVSTSDHNHLADTLALMYTTTNYNTRTLPSAVDVLSIAAVAHWTEVDLPRKDFLTGSSWATASNWEGGRVPDAADAVSIRHGGTVVVSSGLAESDSLRVGETGNGGLQQIGGTLHAAEAWIGSDSTAFAGSLAISGGLFEVGRLHDQPNRLAVDLQQWR